MRRIDDTFHVVEFYRSGENRPFSRRNGILNIPRVGDAIDAFGFRGVVSSVTWNMDYEGKPDEQWRCNVYLKERDQ